MPRSDDKLERQLRREKLRAQIAHQRLRAKAARGVNEALRVRKAGKGGDAPVNYTDSYDSVSRTRLRPGFRARPGSHNAHLDAASHEVLRIDSRKLDRNNPLARAIIQRLVDAVIGKGFSVQSLSANKEWAKQAEAFWNRWYNEEIDVRGMALGTQYDRVVLRAVANDGDIGIIRLDNGQTQLVESERIRTPADKKQNRGYVEGVEIDELGRPVAFHVADTAGRGPMLGFSKTTAVPAEHFDLLTNPLHQRVNQTRGEPVLAATITLLEQLDDLMDARVVKNRLEAYISLVFKSSNPAALQQSLINQASAADPAVAAGYNSGEAQPMKWEPGSILTTQADEEIKVVGAEGQKQDLDQEVIAFVRMICADIGLPLVLSMFNSADTTYHGFKAEIAVAWRGFFRWIELMARLKRRLWMWRIGMAIYRGELPLAEDWDRIRIGVPTVPMIDPKAEYEAAALAANQSLSSRRRIVMDLFGIDIDDLYAEIEEERRTERDKGVGPVAMPGQQSPAPKNKQPDPSGGAENGKSAA
jgi:lambda family phage portal protein